MPQVPTLRALSLAALALACACSQSTPVSSAPQPEAQPGGDATAAQDSHTPDIPAEAPDGVADSAPQAGEADLAVIGATIVGHGPGQLWAKGGVITAIAAPGSAPPGGAEVLDYEGRFLAPAFIDSHVHLAYLPRAAEMAAGGVALAVDHAAPEAFLAQDHAPLRVLAAGPMITATQGYPTQSWGAGGYGREVASLDEAVAAVADLHDKGAALIKLPVDGGPQLEEATLAAVVEAAHARDMRVSVHALGDADARLAAQIGADVLAHTPVQALTPDTLEAWRGRAVISTLAAFGGGPSTLANLTALREREVTVLYGTDFGNTSTAGIDPAEITRLVDAGLTGEEILAAGTSAPAAFWGLDDLGALAPGKAASFLVLSEDPTLEPLTLATPVAVHLAD